MASRLQQSVANDVIIKNYHYIVGCVNAILIFDHEGLHKVHTKQVLYVPNKDLCVQSVVLLQSILDYVKCSTSSITYCLVL